MKRPAIVAYDDMEYTEHDKNIVVADHTLILTIRENDAETSIELDFTDANHTLFWKEMKRWFDMGSVPSNPKRKSPVSTLAYNRAMREWADVNGYEYTQKTDNTYYHPRRLQQAYAEWLEKQEHPPQ